MPFIHSPYYSFILSILLFIHSFIHLLSVLCVWAERIGMQRKRTPVSAFSVFPYGRVGRSRAKQSGERHPVARAPLKDKRGKAEIVINVSWMHLETPQKRIIQRKEEMRTKAACPVNR